MTLPVIGRTTGYPSGAGQCLVDGPTGARRTTAVTICWTRKDPGRLRWITDLLPDSVAGLIEARTAHGIKEMKEVLELSATTEAADGSMRG